MNSANLVTGRRIALKTQLVLTAVAAIEEEQVSRKRKATEIEPEMESDSEDDEVLEQLIEDCTVVA
jgi:hypothetical protein